MKRIFLNKIVIKSNSNINDCIHQVPMCNCMYAVGLMYTYKPTVNRTLSV